MPPSPAMGFEFPDPNPHGPEPRRPFPYPQNPDPRHPNAGALQNLYVAAQRASLWSNNKRATVVTASVAGFASLAFLTWYSIAKDSASGGAILRSGDGARLTHPRSLPPHRLPRREAGRLCRS